MTWPTTAYGCPEPGEFYAQSQVSGWEIFVESEGDTWDYHADSSGDILINCTETELLVQNAINVAQLANLREATEIEMRRIDSTGTYVLKATITDTAEIRTIVDSLDLPVSTRAASSCTEIFRIVFKTPGGQQTIGAVCAEDHRLIRGSQAIFGGRDAISPSEFGAAIGPYFSDEPLPVPPQ